MKKIIDSKLEQLQKEKKALENKRILVSDIQLYREIYLEICLINIMIEHLNKMIEEESYQIVL